MKAVVLMSILFSVVTTSLAQEKSVRGNAGDTNLKTTLVEALTQNKDNFDLHLKYLRLSPVHDSLNLRKQYGIWRKQYPRNPRIPRLMAEYNKGAEREKLLMASLAIDSVQPSLWSELGSMASLRGDLVSSRIFFARAFSMEPSNVEYAFSHVISLEDSVSRRMSSIWFVQQYPNTKRSFQILTSLYATSPDSITKAWFFNKAYHSGGHSQVINDGRDAFAQTIFYRFLDSNLDSARHFAKKMETDKIIPGWMWSDKVRVTEALVNAEHKIKSDSANKALEILKSIDILPVWKREHVRASKVIQNLKLKAWISLNQCDSALKQLIFRYAQAPERSMKASLLEIGSACGLDSMAVMDSVWKIRYSNLPRKMDFRFLNRNTGSEVTHRGLMGKPTLISFWFPSCAPCRAEFKWMDAGISAIRDKINYWAPNINQSEDELVPAIIKNGSYTFTPLTVPDSQFGEAFNDARFASPANFLLDSKGRIIYSWFQVSEENYKDFEWMVKEIIDHEK